MRTKVILSALSQHYYATRNKVTLQFSLNASKFEKQLLSKILVNNFIYMLNKELYLLLYQ